MKRLIAFSGLVFCIIRLFGAEVHQQAAMVAGLNFYKQSYQALHGTVPENLVIASTLIRSSEGKPVFYIFNFNPTGYIIVSAENSVKPVLAYSFDGNCSEEMAPPAFNAWMKQFEDQITDARKSNFSPGSEIIREWNSLVNRGPEVTRSIRGVAPLLTTNWNQNAPYNDHCPADPGGPGGHTYAGCVPVALGQLMYYYRWPLSGNGSYSYYDSAYGTISADFGSTSYLWNNMPNIITTGNEGIGTLLFHLGVSCDLVYGPDGSGMYNHKAAYALRNHFRYSPGTQYLYRDSTSLNWDSILIAHLDRKMPLYYAGWSKPWTDGHAFVCDGYQDSAYFHFNFGWGGQNNGYFYTSNLTPGGNNFKLAQEMIINSYPDTTNNTYPAYCTGTATLPYLTGSLEDGSGPILNYKTGSDCVWLLDPQPENDSVSEITFNLHRFNTSAYDTLKFFKGLDPDDQVIAAYSGDTMPAEIKLSGNKMRIEFKSGSSSGNQGFMGTFKAKVPAWCSGTQTIIADTAEISDGSIGFDYHNNSVCRWILQSKSGKPLTIHFRNFNTEQGKDILRFYDMINSDSLASLSGNYSPSNLPDSVTATSGKMLVIFTTNNNTTAEGWEFYYPKSSVGVNEKTGDMTFSITPNPCTDQIKLSFSTGESGKAQFRILDAAGSELLRQEIPMQPGKNEINIPLTGWRKGFYIAELVSGTKISVKKLIIR
jgi:hypothetical protein